MTDTASLGRLTRWRNGDQQAAQEIVECYLNRLLALARNRLSPKLRARTDPDDVVQSALRSFFRQADSDQFTLKRGDDLWPLLAAITVHKAMKQVKFFQAQKRSIDREGSLNVAGWAVPPQALAREPSPDEAAMIAEELEEVMQGMSTRNREVLELHLQGVSVDEIAETIKISTRSVYRAIEQAQAELEQRLLASGAERA